MGVEKPPQYWDWRSWPDEDPYWRAPDPEIDAGQYDYLD
jgi:hypothetical protein